MNLLRRIFDRSDSNDTGATDGVVCALTRDSVAMGDDATAPNGDRHSIAIADDDATPALSCIAAVVYDHGYLPSVINGSTWLVDVEGTPVAIATRSDVSHRDGPHGGPADTRHVIAIPGAPSFAPAPRTLNMHFHYYHANDPKRMLEELAEGRRPKLIYGEAQSGDAVPHWPDPLGAAAVSSARAAHVAATPPAEAPVKRAPLSNAPTYIPAPDIDTRATDGDDTNANDTSPTLPPR